MVAEADESDRSFLRLYPTLAVVTNIDREHLDVYKDITDIQQAFAQFIGNLPFYGKAFLCYENENIRSLLPSLAHVKCITFGISAEADIWATDIKLDDDNSTCIIFQKTASGTSLQGQLTIPMPGKHNVLNALAATTVALDLEIPFDTITKALATFKGIDRRFSYKGTAHGAHMYDDYAHHPEEIKNALAVARKKAKNKLIVAFQPHRYSRTKHLWNEFIDVLSTTHIDELVITDIYPASEQPIEGITSQRLIANLLEKKPHLHITYAPCDNNLQAIKKAIEPLLAKNDLLLLLGAGKMNTLAELIRTQE